jgi:hypothetical protein
VALTGRLSGRLSGSPTTSTGINEHLCLLGNKKVQGSELEKPPPSEMISIGINAHRYRHGRSPGRRARSMGMGMGPAEIGVIEEIPGELSRRVR